MLALQLTDSVPRAFLKIPTGTVVGLQQAPTPRQAAIIFNLGADSLMLGLQEQRRKPEHIEPETFLLSRGKIIA